MQENNSVVAVIVAYHPDVGLVQAVRSVIGQVDRVIIYDNSVYDEAEALQVASLTAALNSEAAAKLTVLTPGTNAGIGAALNQGAYLAWLWGGRYLLTMDQDSFFPEGGVARLRKIMAQRPECAVASPVHSLEGVAYDITLPTHGGQVEVDTVMTSGNLVDLQSLRLVGGFQDGYFIDCVDHEICLRLRKFGFSIVVDTTLVMPHRLGAASSGQAGRFFRPTHHAAFRRYYMFRNRVMVYRQYGATATRWVRRDMLRAGKEVVTIVFAEHQRLNKLRAVVRGLWDGALNIQGDTYVRRRER